MAKWDLYDNDLKKTNIVIDDTDEVPSGYYHIALEIWIINDKKEVLLIKNAVDYSKRYPGSWNCIGGSLSSKKSINDEIRDIIYNKIGIEIKKCNAVISKPHKRDPYKYAYVTCFINENLNVDHFNYKDETVIGAKFVDAKELINMCNNGEMAYYIISRIKEEVIEYIEKATDER